MHAPYVVSSIEFPMFTLPFQLQLTQNSGHRPFGELSMISFIFNLTGAVVHE
jgi:hypothetical protein